MQHTPIVIFLIVSLILNIMNPITEEKSFKTYDKTVSDPLTNDEVLHINSNYSFLLYKKKMLLSFLNCLTLLILIQTITLVVPETVRL